MDLEKLFKRLRFWKMKENTKEDTMQKYICIPEERYFLMLESYDRVVEELESMKKALEELADSPKAE